MNKIFVWESYGDIKLYATDTPEQLRQIIDTIVYCVRDWNINDKLHDATQFLNSELSEHSRDSCIDVLNNLIDSVSCSSHELFDYCGFIKVKE